MGFMLLVEGGTRIVDVERRFDEATRLFYYIVQIGEYTIYFRGNPGYAGGGKFLVPDEMPDDLPAKLFGEISDAIEKMVT